MISRAFTRVRARACFPSCACPPFPLYRCQRKNKNNFQRNVSLFLEKEPSASVFNIITCIAWMFPGMSVWAVTWAEFVSHDWLFVNPPGEWSKNNDRDSVKNKVTFLALYFLLVYVVEVACSALFGEIVVEFLFCKFMERAVGKLNKPTKKKNENEKLCW